MRKLPIGIGSGALLLLCTQLIGTVANGASLTGQELVAALQRGGYVIVMRHASSPRTPPEPAQANADNVQHERQLDEQGRASARAWGEALRQLRIPIGVILSSPTYRAQETLRLAKLQPPQLVPELGEGDQGMQADPSGARPNWLRARVAMAAPAGTNVLLVTHFPNITQAFPQDSANLADGEALIFHPQGNSSPIVARVKIEDWPELARR